MKEHVCITLMQAEHASWTTFREAILRLHKMLVHQGVHTALEVISLLSGNTFRISISNLYRVDILVPSLWSRNQ